MAKTAVAQTGSNQKVAEPLYLEQTALVVPLESLVVEMLQPEVAESLELAYAPKVSRIVMDTPY
jgi:hypothetical protein